MSIFDNDEGFSVRVERVREPPVEQPAAQDTTPYPDAYRGLLLWLIQQAETPEAAPVVLQGARDLMERVLTDIQLLHPRDIQYVVRGQKHWWGREPDRPCETSAEKFQVLRRAGYITRAFSDRAGHFDSLTATSPDAPRAYVGFLRELIVLLFVTPHRIPV